MRWYSFISCCAVALLYLLYRQEQALAPDLIENNVICTTSRVVDGDTIIALCSHAEYRVRITNIDAPEITQKPYGEQSKRALANLVANHPITLDIKGKDKYNRTLANIFVDDNDISLALVEQGQAVVYKKYHPPEYLLKAQKTAKQAKIGIWAKKGLHQNPSYYRKIK